MRDYINIPLLAVIIVLVVGCSFSEKENVNQILYNITSHFVHDSRVALFDVEAESSNGECVLKGETNLPKAKTALLDSLSAINVTAVDSINVLPDDGLNGKTLGIINN